MARATLFVLLALAASCKRGPPKSTPLSLELGGKTLTWQDCFLGTGKTFGGGNTVEVSCVEPGTDNALVHLVFVTGEKRVDELAGQPLSMELAPEGAFELDSYLEAESKRYACKRVAMTISSIGETAAGSFSGSFVEGFKARGATEPPVEVSGNFALPVRR